MWKARLAIAGLLSASNVIAQPLEPTPASSGETEKASAPQVPGSKLTPSDSNETIDANHQNELTRPSPTAPNLAAETPKSNDEVQALRREIDQLRAEFEMSRSSAEAGDAYERKIDIYGFMDMGFQRVWAGERAATLGTGTSRGATFVLGNINLYFDANPNQTWRALTELRLTNYPNGAEVQVPVPALGIPEQRTNTSVADVNAPDPAFNQVNWGAFVLEQAWIQGTITDWFAVRAGYWLTPFGIWNIDHGSPTLIGLTPPQFTRGRFYPQHQLGVQATGHVTSQAWTFGYTAYVSNGKTSGALDPTDDKAYGLRLSAQTMRPIPLTFGLAAYTGRYSYMGLVTNPQNPLALTQQELISYRQWDVGADISLDIAPFRLRTEFALERVNYDPGKLETTFNIPGMYFPNRTIWGWYTIGAYRLPWLGLEPYLSCELYRYPTPLSEAMLVPGAGFNVHINTEVQVKTQYTRTHFLDFNAAHDHSYQDISMFATRLVIAY